MHLASKHRRALRVGLVAFGMLALGAQGALAQLKPDGDIFWNNIYATPGQTLGDQFISLSAPTAACPVGYSAAFMGTSGMPSMTASMVRMARGKSTWIIPTYTPKRFNTRSRGSLMTPRWRKT